MKSFTPRVLALALCAIFSVSALAAPRAVQVAPLASGLDTKSFDTEVRPQDDFYRYVNGRWTRSVAIPADKASWGSYPELREVAAKQVKTVLEDAVKNPGAADSERHKIADIYTSFLDMKKRDALGFAPVQPELAKIAALQDKAALPELFAFLNKNGVNTPFTFDIAADSKDANSYAAYLSQGGLGMPDRDYYKEDDTQYAAVRAKYQKHVEAMFALAGDKNPAQRAQEVMAIESALARQQWTRVEMRNANKTYNKIDVDKLDDLAPGFDWQAFLKATGAGDKLETVIVRQPTYLASMAKVVDSMPLEQWKSYLSWHVLSNYAAYLSEAAARERFNFTGSVLRGVPEREPDWQLAMRATESVMGEAVGKLYVEKYFPPENKARVLAMVNHFLAAFKDGIEQLTWMSPATKKEALAKLATFKPNIGYPDKWRDYSGLKTVKGDLVANIRAGRLFAYQRRIERLGKTVDRDEWNFTPQTVNASYSPSKNAITFPAGVLQPPFFNVNAEDAVNYGSVGTSIGHEISHGFDDQGSKYDGQGNLRNWWTKEDRENFTALTDRLVKQYGAYSPLPGYFVDGKLTLGENIADNSGLAVALKAYQRSLGGKPSPVIDGLSGEQRLFLAFARKWRGKQRDEAIIVQLKTDPHTPSEFRARGTVLNQPGFYEAFGIKAGDRMYLPPEERVIIW